MESIISPCWERRIQPLGLMKLLISSMLGSCASKEEIPERHIAVILALGKRLRKSSSTGVDMTRSPSQLGILTIIFLTSVVGQSMQHIIVYYYQHRKDSLTGFAFVFLELRGGDM